MGLTTRIVNKGTVKIQPGFSVPRVIHIETDEDEPLPYAVKLEVAYLRGRFVCTSLTCKQWPEGEPVTGEGIRSIPVASILRRGLTDPFFVMRFKVSGSTLRSTPLDVPRDITGKGPTDDALEMVALAYRLAYALGDAPTKGVMERLKLSRSTAGKWVMLARERGYLGPTTPGAAGEQED